MPFTPAHIAAVLPIAALSRRTLPFSALVIGSMIPDLPLFVPFSPSYVDTHSISGIFTVCTPLGLVCLVIFRCLLKRPLFALLPDAARRRCAHVSRPSIEPTVSFFAASAVALVIGAATHIFWDSFTHAGRWGTTVFPILNESRIFFGRVNLKLCDALQYACSFVFLPLVFVILAVWLVRQKPVELEGLPGVNPLYRVAAYFAMLVTPICVMLWLWLRDPFWTPAHKLGWLITRTGLALGVITFIYCFADEKRGRKEYWGNV
jgi:hypothetical protein